MKRVMVQLTEEQIAALKELAKERKTSVARLVRESVAQYVVIEDQVAAQEAKRLALLEFLDYIKEHPQEFCDKDGKTDVSVNHDKYLAEIYGTW